MSAELVITIKYKGRDGKGYDQPWAVFHGESQDALAYDIGTYFGMPEEQYKDVPLHEVVLIATEYAHGTRNVASVLGGTVVKEGWGNNDPDPSDWTRGTTPQEAPGASVTDERGGSGTEVAPNPHAALLEEIEAATDQATLKRLWATNKDAFTDEAVQTAWKARGKALKA